MQLALGRLETKKRGLTWIDGLCLPSQLLTVNGLAASGEVFQSVRDIAGSADAVVVLDSDIATLSVNCSYEEAFFKITYSSWNSRLWTLYEAVVAKHLFFKCADGLLNLPELDHKFQLYRQTGNDTLPELPYHELRDLVRNLDFHATSERYYQLIDNVLTHRRVGSAADREFLSRKLRETPEIKKPGSNSGDTIVL